MSSNPSNQGFGAVVGSVSLAATISFTIGTVALLGLYLIGNFNSSLISIKELANVPTVLYAGGVLGAVYVATVAASVPRIGVANTMVALVLGQILLSLILDHFGVLGIEMREVSWQRLVGAGLVVSGLVLVVKY